MPFMRQFLHEYFTQSCIVHPLVPIAVADIWPELYLSHSQGSTSEKIYQKHLCACLWGLFHEQPEPIWKQVRSLSWRPVSYFSSAMVSISLQKPHCRSAVVQRAGMNGSVVSILLNNTQVSDAFLFSRTFAFHQENFDAVVKALRLMCGFRVRALSVIHCIDHFRDSDGRITSSSSPLCGRC